MFSMYRPRGLAMPFTLIMTLKSAHRSAADRCALVVALCVALYGVANGQTSQQEERAAGETQAGRLNVNQVVSHLTQMNTARAQALHAYESTRVYRLEYKGFPGGRSAEMVVKVKYRAPGTKEFEIV